jgi:hypothetical protein
MLSSVPQLAPGAGSIRIAGALGGFQQTLGTLVTYTPPDAGTHVDTSVSAAGRRAGGG